MKTTNDLLNRAGKFGLIAGGLWITHYLLQLSYGLATGGHLFENPASPFMTVDGTAFFGVYITLGLAQLSLHRALRPHAVIVPTLGAVIATISFLAGFTALGTMWMDKLFGSELFSQVIRYCGPMGILTTFLSALLAAGFILRKRVLPRSVGMGLLLFGLLTAPIAMLLAMLFDPILPLYVHTEVHFVGAGLLWLYVGHQLRRTGAGLVQLAIA